jgi:septal ring factor EnvC (AmiA/AmiB activator)
MTDDYLKRLIEATRCSELVRSELVEFVMANRDKDTKELEHRIEEMENIEERMRDRIKEIEGQKKKIDNRIATTHSGLSRFESRLIEVEKAVFKYKSVKRLVFDFALVLAFFIWAVYVTVLAYVA